MGLERRPVWHTWRPPRTADGEVDLREIARRLGANPDDPSGYTEEQRAADEARWKAEDEADLSRSRR